MCFMPNIEPNRTVTRAQHAVLLLLLPGGAHVDTGFVALSPLQAGEDLWQTGGRHGVAVAGRAPG